MTTCGRMAVDFLLSSPLQSSPPPTVPSTPLSSSSELSELPLPTQAPAPFPPHSPLSPAPNSLVLPHPPAPLPKSAPLPKPTPASTSRTHACPHCPESFNQKVRFLFHLLSVHSIRTFDTHTILPCDKCPSAFLRKTDRSKHDACVHQKLRPYRCTMAGCRSSFFFAKDLSKHQSTVHLRHKPFVCQTCRKAFGKREHMTSHVKRVHQKLRPFKCDVCNIRLASKYNLQGHLKTAAHAAAENVAKRRAGK